MAYIKCLRNVITSTVPDGATVTPTDVVATWLACGSRTEGYTTLSAVLADSTCLNALMASDNAVDYLVRSTTFASDITSDSGAMTAIGLNNYCANTLLADSDWCSAICNSTYFESVLNVKVPTMTSATTPSGEVSASSYPSGFDDYLPWQAFDDVTTPKTKSWQSTSASNEWLEYDFTSSIPVYLVKILPYGEGYGPKNCKIQAYVNGAWSDAGNSFVVANDFTCQSFIINNDGNSQKWRIYCTDNYGGHVINIVEMQFYGREDV